MDEIVTFWHFHTLYVFIYKYTKLVVSWTIFYNVKLQLFSDRIYLHYKSNELSSFAIQTLDQASWFLIHRYLLLKKCGPQIIGDRIRSFKIFKSGSPTIREVDIFETLLSIKNWKLPKWMVQMLSLITFFSN